MYWGKSLDQCTDQFCNSKWGFTLPFAQTPPQTPDNKCLRIQNPKIGIKSNPTQKDKVGEKRSLKRSQNNLNSQTSSSVNNSTIFFTQTKNSTDVGLSKKTSVRNFSQREQMFPGKIPDTSTNANTLRCNTPKYRPMSYMNSVDFSSQAWLKQNKIKDGPIYKFSNQSHLQQNIPIKKICQIRTECSENVSSYTHSNSFCQENSFRRHSIQKIENLNFVQSLSPNRRNYEHVNMEKQNIRVFDPRELNAQSIRQQICYQNNNLHRIQVNSPRNYLQPTHGHNTPVHSIQNLVNDQTYRYLPNEFPTIRQQNSAYEQSKSINDCSHARSLNSARFYDLEQKTQNISLLSAINNSLSQEQYKNQQTFYDVLRNKETQFEPGLDSSKIQGNSKMTDFNLSCEELLLESEKPQQPQENLEKLKFQQVKTHFKSPSKQMAHQRRIVHQPSICLKVIENKLRGNNYQMSQTSSQGIQSQLRSSNPFQSRQEFVIPSLPTPQTIISPRQGSSQQPSTMRSPCRMKMAKNLVRFKFHKRSGFGENKQNHIEQNSPIKILDSYRESQIHNFGACTKLKDKDKLENHSLHEGLLKQLSLNLNDNSSEKDPQPSIRKMCLNQKKVKSLVQHKLTINSIFQDSTSLNKQCSNQLISRYLLDDNFDLFEAMLSNQNVNRDESTVIDRYTFNSRMEKLP